MVALLLIAGLDAAWRGLIAGDFYHRELATLLRAKTWLWPVALLYLAYPAGLVLMALQPWPARAVTAAWRSAVVGLMAYGTHALSNLATVLGVNPPLAMVDIAWGALASAVAGTAAWLIGRRY